MTPRQVFPRQESSSAPVLVGQRLGVNSFTLKYTFLIPHILYEVKFIDHN